MIPATVNWTRYYYVNQNGTLKSFEQDAEKTAWQTLEGLFVLHATPEAALAHGLAECAKEHAELRRRRVALNKRQANLRKQLGLAP